VAPYVPSKSPKTQSKQYPMNSRNGHRWARSQQSRSASKLDKT